MKVSAAMRWVGPAAITLGVFMVFSAISRLPIQIPFVSESAPPGFEAVGSGLVLWALVLLLVGMAGLYAREPEPGAARVIEHGSPESLEREALDEELERLLENETTVVEDRPEAGAKLVARND